MGAGRSDHVAGTPAGRSWFRGREPDVGDAFIPIAGRLIRWHARHGRRNLPWQSDPTPYRVWVSEIMLQQTRVSVVIGYYERFMARFPGLVALADAPLDDVLGLWTGLGYYSRARNLHRAAALVRDRHGGTMPRDLDALVSLPGIGRSTAGAILALSHGDRHPILDGNVKRVLCRYHGVAGWPGEGRVERVLWALAERHTPHEGIAAYTQAIMDLGATLCVRSRPLCSICPIETDCVARREGAQAEYPAPRPRRAVPRRETAFLVLRDPAGALLLERRPPVGIWGGLWCFPECDPAADFEAVCRARFDVRPIAVTALAPIAHGFTHFKLDVYPILVEVGEDDGIAAAGADDPGRHPPGDVAADSDELRWHSPGTAPAGPDGAHRYSSADPPAEPDRFRRHSSAVVADAGGLRWYASGALAGIGLAAPVKRLIEELASDRRSIPHRAESGSKRSTVPGAGDHRTCPGSAGAVGG